MNTKEIYETLVSEGKIYGALGRERFVKLEVARIPKEIVESFKKVPDITCELSDSMDRLGYSIGKCTIEAGVISPLKAEYRTVGTAITQRSCPEKIRRDIPVEQKKSLMSTRDAAYFAQEGDILIVDAKGCASSNFGEIAAKIMQEHKLSATIVDGLVRDGESIKKIGYPFWCKGQTPYSGMRRIETVEINGTITLHDVQVNPGDLVAADANGICVIPWDIVEDVYNDLRANGIC